MKNKNIITKKIEKALKEENKKSISIDQKRLNLKNHIDDIYSEIHTSAQIIQRRNHIEFYDKVMYDIFFSIITGLLVWLITTISSDMSVKNVVTSYMVFIKIFCIDNLVELNMVLITINIVLFFIIIFLFVAMPLILLVLGIWVYKHNKKTSLDANLQSYELGKIDKALSLETSVSNYKVTIYSGEKRLSRIDLEQITLKVKHKNNS